jgi:integrase/recombinase XerD
MEPEEPVDSITATVIRRYRESLAERCAPATVNAALSALRSFFRWTMEEGLHTDDPTLYVTGAKKPRPSPRSLKSSEVSMLMQVMTVPDTLTDEQLWYWQRNRRAVMLMLYTGLRLSEAAALHWHNVDFDDDTVVVYDGKGGKDRLIPLHAALREVLEQVPAHERQPSWAVVGKRTGEALNRKGLCHTFDRWLHGLGVKVTAHQLRHTFATQMMKEGANLRVVQELLGHADMSTTQRYLFVDMDQKQAAVNGLPNW